MTKQTAILLGEFHESFSMAIGALAAHKLRSALTLLGVLIGVFSIIVVMTAMRVLQKNIETQLSSLGAQTFRVTKWPGLYFGGPDGMEKYWRRKNINLAQGRRDVRLPPVALYKPRHFCGHPTLERSDAKTLKV